MHLTQGAIEGKKIGRWKMEFEESTHAKVLRLFKKGLSRKEICKQTDIDRSNVSRQLKKARQQHEI